ncbi:hypothetical protein GALL_538710 [mine drainage metagenome]|uniref:Uncharacterized protein n=1 Tax=mine drainage metagenome TaxID=410659 RepID=A0A1J5P1U9_9ZZZZ
MIALAEFDVLGDHGHHAVGADLDEGAEGAEVHLGADGQQVAGRAADQQGAADQGRAHHQVAPGGAGLQVLGIHGSVHGCVPQALTGAAGVMPAASLMAARMR